MTSDTRATRLTEIRDYLSTTGQPPLTDDQRLDLQSPITTKEIESTVKSLSDGKSPGLDGFTKAYYLMLSLVLMNPMCRYFNSLAPWQKSIIPPEALLAHISVILKEGKYPHCPSKLSPHIFTEY